MTGHKLDAKVRRFNKLKSDLESFLIDNRVNRKDPEEKVLFSFIADAIDYANEVSSREDERLNLFI